VVALISIKSDFEERCNEADILLQHISEMSLTMTGNVQETSILKSAFVILLYNVIESTMTSVLERVHEKISRVHYLDSSDKIKLLIVEFYFKNKNTRHHKLMVDDISNNKLNLPLLSEFTNRINLFSGNLDAREIDNILGRYGIGSITSKDRSKLLFVKNKRNKIAHGEEMFKESCRNSTVSELRDIKKAVSEVLSQVIDLTESYFQYEKYRA
jgi:hypothetical protein